MKTSVPAKATMKNLLVLERLLERMRTSDERLGDRPILTGYDLHPGERYHADRLVVLGYLKKRTGVRLPECSPLGLAVYFHDETCRKSDFPWKGMRGKRMQEMLASGEAVDLSGYPRSNAGEYFLGRFDPERLHLHEEGRLITMISQDSGNLFREGLDYCNAREERWICSIGIHRENGYIWASHDAGKYQNPAFLCIWLR